MLVLLINLCTFCCTLRNPDILANPLIQELGQKKKKEEKLWHNQVKHALQTLISRRGVDHENDVIEEDSSIFSTSPWYLRSPKSWLNVLAL